MEYAENFEAWCADCVRVTDKLTGASVPFRLNAPQRRVAALMESRRRAGLPVRIIMLKARQWGGSTLTQIYMAWMQIVRHKGWNSLICSHVKDASANIRGIYSHLLRCYPEELRGADADPRGWVFTPYEKSSNVCCIPARDCRVALTSALAPDAVRGTSFQMAHLSEVAFWADGDREAAGRIVRTVSGSVPLMPDTVVVMESTADGTDNYFYDEWQRAVKGESDKTPVFVPWHEIEIYSMQLTDSEREAWPEHFDDYELALLHKKRLPVEKVAWYHCKRREYATHEQMMAEYPSTPAEAFSRVSTPWLTASESDLLRVDTAPSASGRPILVVMVAGGGGDDCSIGLVSATADGVCGLVTEPVAVGGGIADALRVLGNVSRRHGVECVVALAPCSGVSHRWLERRLTDSSLRCRADSSEHLTLPLDSADTFTHARNCWRDMLADGRWVEPDEASCRHLRSLKASATVTDAALLLRLAAARALASDSRSEPLKPGDFL